MAVLIVVNSPKYWPMRIPGVEVVPARAYLTDPTYSEGRGARVFNLCRSYRYQSLGYYVSLLAAARGHKPMPSVTTIQDLKLPGLTRLASEEIEDLIQESLRSLQSGQFVLSIYFGRNLARRYDRLSWRMFSLFPAPFLRALFVHSRKKGWRLQSVSPIAFSEIPEDHHPFVLECATEYFSKNRTHGQRKAPLRYDMAILHNPEEPTPPSNDRALQNFIRAAKRLDIDAELITKEDYEFLPQYDALFIRETTSVDHHTYRFARRAVAEGLVVVDDPESILRCTNKVYLAELLSQHHISKPTTLIVHRDNVGQVREQIGLPCILKKPDSSFSQGVYKVADLNLLEPVIEGLLQESELIIAQKFIPTEFDWRVGIFDRQPLYVCKYHMAKDHWQIQRTDTIGRTHYGEVETLRVEDAPAEVVRAALRAAQLIGDGLYGVDLKEKNGRVYVIEINDNPSIESGFEDRALKDELYNRIMQVFLTRIERQKNPRPAR